MRRFVTRTNGRESILVSFGSKPGDDLGIIGNPGDTAVSGEGFEDTRWFPGATLNIVNTLLAGNPDEEVLSPTGVRPATQLYARATASRGRSLRCRLASLGGECR